MFAVVKKHFYVYCGEILIIAILFLDYKKKLSESLWGLEESVQHWQKVTHFAITY
jgi:hypothetical protein